MRARCAGLMMFCALLLLTVGCGQIKFPPHYTDQGNYTFFYDPDTRAKFPRIYFKDEFALIRERLRERNAVALDNATSCNQGYSKECAPPKSLIGLGLSGGGIRSNAFQLGFLSGLEGERDTKFAKDNSTKASMLDNVSYLSAVSGGSWAMGALAVNATLATNTNGTAIQEYFAQLDSTVLQRKPDKCDDEERRSSLCGCDNRALCTLSNAYTPVMREVRWSNIFSDPFDMHSGYYVRNAWRRLLLNFNLRGEDVFLSDLANGTSQAPFVIFNPTHSAGGVGQGEKHFPFQITPLGVGTVADCGNTDYCGGGKHAGFFRRFDKGTETANATFPAFPVSQAMAMAGAVAPESFLGIPLNLMEWKLSVLNAGWSKSTKDCGGEGFFADKKAMCESEYGNAAIEREGPVNANEKISSKCNCISPPKDKPVQRSWYILGDGGHSENLGTIALLERGVDFIVISDAGCDPLYKYEDYGVLKKHAHKLLHKSIKLETDWDFGNEKLDDKNPTVVGWIKGWKENKVVIPGEPDKNELAIHARTKIDTMRGVELSNNVTLGYAQNSTLQGEGGKTQLVVYVRPAYNIHKGFMADLRERANGDAAKGKIDSGYVHTYRYLAANPGVFPNDKTLALSYERELIYAYYLLGQYIAKEDVAPLLKAYLLQNQ